MTLRKSGLSVCLPACLPACLPSTFNCNVSVLECGVDIRDVTIVILVQPYGRLHAIVQACGRCGRVDRDGRAKKSACVLLYENHDIATNVPGMSSEVREFCKTNNCLKVYLEEVFGSGMTSKKSDDSWCCSNCDA